MEKQNWGGALATEAIAKAYVQIIPTTKGISGSISTALGGEATSAGQSAGQSYAGSFAGGLKAALIAAGIGTMIKSVVSAGGELEQSIGGVETLFGAQGAKSAQEYAQLVGKSLQEVEGEFESLSQAQAQVLQDAKDAYQTAGLSANDYMQTVIGFGAALKQSTESEAEAASVAKMAVVDMSDNANKMGTDMESIQNAYQGFAKQNYTINNLMSAA